MSALYQVGSWASQQHPALELQFAVAKARRQRLREQHQQLIRQELLKLEEELAGNQQVSGEWTITRDLGLSRTQGDEAIKGPKSNGPRWQAGDRCPWQGIELQPANAGAE